jgi:glycosyltransferase involved in cell wall biosynthesis
MKILAFAYACEPDKGSEPGAGWVWARMIARLGETWVLTRKNNRPVIEGALASIPERDRLHFVYVDLPWWARFWKRGQRGVRIYYLLWQFAALARAWRLKRERRFDVVWHLTLANVWLGSLAPLVGPPFVYGPVGGGIGVPWRLLPSLGLRGSVYELVRAAVRKTGRYLNPLARLAWRRAAVILVQTPETRDWLPTRYKEKTAIFPNAILEHPPLARHRRAAARPTALFAGRLLPLKGVALAIRAMTDLPLWQLMICGAGPDERRLRRLAKRLRVKDRIQFAGWKPRPELLRIMREEVDLFLFPSLHDESPWVIAEAIGCGLPVVCLDRGGPRILAQAAARVVSAKGSREQVSRALAASILCDLPEASNATSALALSLPVVLGQLKRVLDKYVVSQPTWREVGVQST